MMKLIIIDDDDHVNLYRQNTGYFVYLVCIYFLQIINLYK